VQIHDLIALVEAFIISWPGRLESAKRIARALVGEVDSVTVIHSDDLEEESVDVDPFVIHRVDNSYFFGRKFGEIFELRNPDKSFLLIQADAEFEDWPRLTKKLRNALESFSIGVWAPNVDHSSWRTSKVHLRALNQAGLVQVTQTDGIIFYVSSEVANQLATFDYTRNNLGWGVDWAAILTALNLGQLVVRDTSITVRHRQGSGYNQEAAHHQQEQFLDQLTEAQKAILVLLRRSHRLSSRTVKLALRIDKAIDNLTTLVGSIFGVAKLMAFLRSRARMEAETQ